MRTIRMLVVGLPLALAATALALGQGPADGTLDIYVIDVEGGEATLFVGPSGDSLLVDTGWPGFDGRDADRIAAAARDAGVTELDYVIVTHFHTDHMGGSVQLAERIPVRTWLDHGTTVDEGERRLAAFGIYTDLRSTGEHRVVAPGDTVEMEGLEVTIIASHGEVLADPLPGAGGPNPRCGDFVFHGEDITSRYGDAEDARSISAFIRFGEFRTVIMGDLTWNKEHPLVCPDNKLGTVDLYLVSHHGSDTSGAPAFVHALAPRVGVMNNGPRKGGAVLTFQILEESATLEDLWQNHYSLPGGDRYNAPGQYIANVTEGTALPDGRTVHMGAAHWIHVSASSDGSFEVTNSRNGFSRRYEP
ncbi:MAG: MBL fold metallo-hydrolase [Acidobacteria bacterium]|nr:MBL fold metallo-hydrolase [Acidobacteriota bacterium]MYD70024.1 MBL fold metallo-hydrolase [Acidobacteriota bacterium]MYJ05526.1 MBL fold metallo-hydrolase [Acidobacteriota bacterium]